MPEWSLEQHYASWLDHGHDLRASFKIHDLRDLYEYLVREREVEAKRVPAFYRGIAMANEFVIETPEHMLRLTGVGLDRLFTLRHRGY